MKKGLKYFLATAFMSLSCTALADDCNIPMCVVIDEGFSNVTSEAASILEGQLQRLAEHSGLNIGWDNAQFAITAKFDQIDRHIVKGAPTQIVNVFGVTIYVADVFYQKQFASTYIEIKGVGTNETKASVDAIRRLNAQNTQISKFMSTIRQKIISYYDTQLPTILKEVQVKASMKQYEEALAKVAIVPSCCNGYETAMKEALRIYSLYRDTYYQAQLNKAKALWASDPTIGGSGLVCEILANIDPDAKCYSEAMNLLSQVAKTVKTDIDFHTKKKYEDSVELEKLRIKAISEIGKAYASNRPKAEIYFLGHHGNSISIP